MIFFGIFKTRKPRQFNYMPRYYDAEKEAREQRRKELLGDSAMEEIKPEDYKPGIFIRDNMMRRRGLAPGSNLPRSRTKLTRTLLLLALLGIAAWWILH